MDISELTDIPQIELQLMTTALYFGEFAAIQALLQPESRIGISLRQNDLVALKKYAGKIIVDLDSLDEDEREKYHSLFQRLQETYEAAIKQQPIPLPEAFLEELAEAALKMGKYLSAHNTLQHLKRVDKKVNEYVTNGVQTLKSKIVAEIDKNNREEAFKLIESAAENFYTAIRLKKPMGVPYQYLGVELFTRNAEIRRKYDRYVEQGESVLKEIINSCITYLFDDPATSEKIINNIKNNRTRKFLLKQLAIQFSGGSENYEIFTKQIREASENVKNAKTELDYMQTQRILLGRTTGSDTLVQYLKELATRFPLSPMMIQIEHSPANVPFLAPLMLKERTLAELLEL